MPNKTILLANAVSYANKYYLTLAIGKAGGTVWQTPHLVLAESDHFIFDPRIAVDDSTVVVAWLEDPTGEMFGMYARTVAYARISRDGGETWSPVSTLGHDDPENRIAEIRLDVGHGYAAVAYQMTTDDIWEFLGVYLTVAPLN